MPALPVGASAPPVTLKTLDGARLHLDLRYGGDPTVLAFFKVSCPVCQYAFPYLDRIYQEHKNGKAKFVAVSQDSRAETEAFIKRFGVHFLVLMDDHSGYPASNLFGLTAVPSIFLVEGGSVVLSTVGWNKAAMEDLNGHLASGGKIQEIFRPAEQIAVYKPG